MVAIFHTLALLAVTTGAASAAFKECAMAPAVPEDRRANTTQLKYATYNAEFLFLTGYGGLDCPGSDCKWTTQEAARTHIATVATVINELDADIIQLVEVEDCVALEALIEAIGDDSYKPYLVKGTDTYTGQNVGLITRIDPVVDVQRSSVAAPLPVANSTCPDYSGHPAKKSVSKHLFTTFEPEGLSAPLTVIGAHLLAQPDSIYRCFDREGQAAVLAELAANATALGHHVIVSGDLNDFSRSTPDRNNNAPISNVLGLLENTEFYNVGGSANQTERFSQWWDEDEDCAYGLDEVSTLDHVIVSNSLKEGIVNVFYGHELYEASCSGFQSDHYPIMVTFEDV